jgi:hypothetical protein
MGKSRKQKLTPEMTTAREWEEPVTLFVQGYGTPEQQEQTVQTMVYELQVKGFKVKDYRLGE